MQKKIILQSLTNYNQNIVPYLNTNASQFATTKTGDAYTLVQSMEHLPPHQYVPLLLLRIEPSVPKTAKAKRELTSKVPKMGGIIFLNKFK